VGLRAGQPAAGRVMLWIVALAMTLAGAARAASPLSMQLLDPALGDVKAERVLAGELGPAFNRELSPKVRLPAHSAPRWLRIALPPRADSGTRVLAIGRMPMQRLTLYLPRADGGWDAREDSFFEPRPARFFPDAFVFDLPARLDGGGVLYLRVENRARLYLAVDVLPARKMYERQRLFTMALTAGFTALAVMLLVNLVFLIGLREKLYALYVGFLAAQLIWVLFATGIAYVLPGAGLWSAFPGSISGFAVTLSSALMLQFARLYALPADRHRHAERSLRVLELGFFVLAAGYLLPVGEATRWVSEFATPWFALSSPLLFAVMLRAACSGSRQAWVFLLAWLPLGVVGMIRTAISFGVAAPDTLFLYAPLFAAAYQAVTLAIGLAARMLELRVQRDRAQFLADYDGLTACLSRRAAEVRLRALIDNAMHTQQPLALLFVDLDHLKDINDRYSHDAGDACLLTLSRCVREVLGTRGELGRWGGDEFLVLLPGATVEDARALAEQIRIRVRNSETSVLGVRLPLSVSTGVAAWKPGESIEELVRHADAALYDAKRGGRNRVAVA